MMRTIGFCRYVFVVVDRWVKVSINDGKMGLKKCSVSMMKVHLHWSCCAYKNDMLMWD